MIVTQGSKPVVATTAVKARKSQRNERQKAVTGSRTPLKAALAQQQQINVLQRWSEAGQLNHDICRQQQAERSYRYLYSALEQLRRPLQKNFYPQISGSEQEKLQQQLAALVLWREQRVTALDDELLFLPQTAPVYRRLLTSRIDLIAPRAQTEHISILFGRTGATVSVKLLAGASAEDNLQQLQQAFAREQIKVQPNAQQQLEFSATESQKRKLEENWLLTGEGIRVAAGNPVTISLSRSPCRLQRLQQTISQHNNPATLASLLTEEQQFIRQQLKAIQQQQAELNTQVNQLAPTLQPEQAVELLETSWVLQQLMHPDSPQAIKTFLAQAQVSAYLVRFALKQHSV